MTSADSSLRTLDRSTSRHTPGVALIVGGLVICVGLLSFYGYLVHKQVERGETFRQAQRVGLYAVQEARLLLPKRALSVDSEQLMGNTNPR